MLTSSPLRGAVTKVRVVPEIEKSFEDSCTRPFTETNTLLTVIPCVTVKPVVEPSPVFCLVLTSVGLSFPFIYLTIVNPYYTSSNTETVTSIEEPAEASALKTSAFEPSFCRTNLLPCMISTVVLPGTFNPFVI